MKKFLFFCYLFMLFGFIFAKNEFNEDTIREELLKTGVKLVAIDFYTIGCKPCDDAIPTWKKLKKEYGDDIFLIVVAPRRKNGTCNVEGWNPDRFICDEDTEIAGTWGVDDFPQAFLYSWHNNNPLVQHGHVKDVENAIKKYYETIPKVELEADSNSLELLPLVEEALITQSKLDVIANGQEQQQMRDLKRKSHQLNFDENLKCELEKEISANSTLKITRSINNLSLSLSSKEAKCTKAETTKKLSGDPKRLKAEIASAVYELLTQMFGNFSVPKQKNIQKKDLDNFKIGTGPEVKVEFKSSPAGAIVLADGRTLCQTPCTKPLPSGWHKIEMQKMNYLPVVQKQEIKKGKTVEYTLEPDFAWLSVDGAYNVPIELDGKNIGNIPIKNFPIEKGNHQVEHASECFYKAGERFTVGRGKHKKIPFDLKPRMSAVKVNAKDENGNDLVADVFVDGLEIGKTPGTFKVPLCTQSIIVKTKDAEYSSQLTDILEENKVSTIDALLTKNKKEESSEESEEDRIKNRDTSIIIFSLETNSTDIAIIDSKYAYSLGVRTEIGTTLFISYTFFLDFNVGFPGNKFKDPVYWLGGGASLSKRFYPTKSNFFIAPDLDMSYNGTLNKKLKLQHFTFTPQVMLGIPILSRRIILSAGWNLGFITKKKYNDSGSNFYGKQKTFINGFHIGLGFSLH